MSWRALFRPSVGDGEGRRRWRHFARLTGAYYLSSEWKVAWAMLLTVIGTRFGSVYVVGMQSLWFKALFDAIGDKRSDLMMPLVWQMGIIMLLTTVYGLIGGYVQAMLAMRWRAWLTADYQERWLRDDRYLAIERADRVDNADQRMTEDIILFTQQFLGLSMGLLTALSTIWVFGGQLLAISDAIRFSVFGQVVVIPGDLVIYAILYALIGSWAVHMVGRIFVHLTMRQQMLEANYRFRLINVRRNAEQIAFSRAASSEWRMLNGDFGLLFRNFRKTQYANVGIGFVSGIYSGIQEVLPIFLILPKYFAGRVSMGDIVLARQGFGSFSMALSWFVQSYPTIAIVIASVNRLRALDQAIEARETGAITVAHDAPTIVARGLDLARPDGTPLVRIGDWRVAPGERWCITGPSGAGKSTLLRAIAGIWPYGHGAVELPDSGAVMFLPQRGYLPIGTLKEALAFPGTAETFNDDACIVLLQRFGLNQWAASLHESARWSERLSPGEQQRLALARVLLHRPAWLFLDEATSALDPANAVAAFETLLAELPDLTLVSVVHDPALERFHGRKLVIEQGHATILQTANA